MKLIKRINASIKYIPVCQRTVQVLIAINCGNKAPHKIKAYQYPDCEYLNKRCVINYPDWGCSGYKGVATYLAGNNIAGKLLIIRSTQFSKYFFAIGFKGLA